MCASFIDQGCLLRVIKNKKKIRKKKIVSVIVKKEKRVAVIK